MAYLPVFLSLSRFIRLRFQIILHIFNIGSIPARARPKRCNVGKHCRQLLIAPSPAPRGSSAPTMACLTGLITPSLPLPDPHPPTGPLSVSLPRSFFRGYFSTLPVRYPSDGLRNSAPFLVLAMPLAARSARAPSWCSG